MLSALGVLLWLPEPCSGMKWQNCDQQPLGWCRSARMTRSTPLAVFRELKVQESEPGPFTKASERSTSKQTRSEETSPRCPPLRHGLSVSRETYP